MTWYYFPETKFPFAVRIWYLLLWKVILPLFFFFFFLVERLGFSSLLSLGLFLGMSTSFICEALYSPWSVLHLCDPKYKTQYWCHSWWQY